MSSCQRVARPLVRSLRQDLPLRSSTSQFPRAFSRTAPRREDEKPPTTTPPPSSSTTSPPTPSSGASQATSATSTNDSGAPVSPAEGKTGAAVGGGSVAATAAAASASPSTSAGAGSNSSSSNSSGDGAGSSNSRSAFSGMTRLQKFRMKERLLDRDTTTAHWAERKLVRMGTPPIGSRRRRAALRTSPNIPFEQLPYQCFQEARRILQEDRAERIQSIRNEMSRIRKLEATPADQIKGGEARKQMRLVSLRKQLEEFKILADINDPVVKRRFEDGDGDMSKPIYRHLAEQKWRGYPYRLLTQRISQLHIVPDVLPKFDPVMDVQLYFRRIKVEPGEILNSRITEVPPRLRVQCFDPGERLVSVVVMDSDVPNLETDSFDRRCHYLAANVPISPTQPSLPLGRVDKESQLAVPWLPAFSQKGAPYHRLSIFLLEQPRDGPPLDIAKLRELYSARDGFSLKSFRDKFGLRPVGFNLFRTVWDENTAAVMERAGVPGADLQFKHRRVHSLKPDRPARGWEAKRQKPKYRQLWKYSKRIHGFGLGRRR